MNNAVRPMTSLAIGHPHPHHLPHLHCVHFHPQRRRAFSQSLSGESKASNPSSTQNHRELTIDADDVKVLHDEGKLTSDGNSDDVTPTVIDGREISEESVEHFINSIGSSNPEDIEKFQQLAEKHLSHINFEAFDTSDFDPSKLGDIAELQVPSPSQALTYYHSMIHQVIHSWHNIDIAFSHHPIPCPFEHCRPYIVGSCHS